MGSFKIKVVSDTTREMDAMGAEHGKTYETREAAQVVADRLDAEQRAAKECDVDWEPVEYKVVPTAEHAEELAKLCGVECADAMSAACFPLPDGQSYEKCEPIGGDWDALYHALGMRRDEIPRDVVKAFERAYSDRVEQLAEAQTTAS